MPALALDASRRRRLAARALTRPRPPVTSGAATSASDEALLAAFARTRDAAHLDALLRRHWEETARVALRALGDPAAAEDAAQEAWIGVARGAASFRPGSFRAWLRALVMNAVRNAARGRRRRSRHEDEVAVRRPGAAPADLEGPLVAAEVEEHVRRLPVDVRVAIVLHYFEGRPHDEVALALGCPKGTVASRIRRGLERLKESLEGAGYAALAICDVDGLLARVRLEAPPGGALPPMPPAASLVSRAGALGARAALWKAAAALAVPAVLAGALLLAPRPAPPPFAPAPPQVAQASPPAPQGAQGDAPPAREDALAAPPRGTALASGGEGPSSSASPAGGGAPAGALAAPVSSAGGATETASAIDLEGTDMALRAALAEIAAKSGATIDVEGLEGARVTVRLRRLPWKQVLAAVAHEAPCEVVERGPSSMLVREARRVGGPTGKERLHLADASAEDVLHAIEQAAGRPVTIAAAVESAWGLTASFAGPDWRGAAAALTRALGGTPTADLAPPPAWRAPREGAPSAVTAASLALAEGEDLRAAVRRVEDAYDVNLHAGARLRGVLPCAVRLEQAHPKVAIDALSRAAGLGVEAWGPRLFVLERLPRVSCEFGDADVRVLLDLLARQAGTSFILHVRGEAHAVCVRFTSTPGEATLSAIVEAAGLDAAWVGGVLVVRDAPRAAEEAGGEPASGAAERPGEGGGPEEEKLPSVSVPEGERPARDIFADIARQAGIDVRVDAAVAATVDVMFSNVPARRALVEVARAANAEVVERGPRAFVIRSLDDPDDAGRVEVRAVVSSLADEAGLGIVYPSAFAGRIARPERTGDAARDIEAAVAATDGWRAVVDGRSGLVTIVRARRRE